MNPPFVPHPYDYFNAKIIMYVTGALGIILVFLGVVVFFLDSTHMSFYILTIGITCISLMSIGIKVLTCKWRHLMEEIEGVSGGFYI